MAADNASSTWEADHPLRGRGRRLVNSATVRVPIEGGGELYCQVGGVGPKVVFLHAFPLSGRMWNRVTAQLDVCAIVPDLRGHGRSSSFDETSIEVLADDVIGLLDALGIGEPAVFCGLSLGSIVALDLYRRHRNRVRGLVLAGCRPLADTPKRDSSREALARQVEAIGSTVAAEVSTDRLLARSTPESVRAEVSHIIAANDPIGVASVLRALARRQDNAAVARSIECPALLVYGLLDTVTPPELGVSLYSDIESMSSGARLGCRASESTRATSALRVGGWRLHRTAPSEGFARLRTHR